MDGEGIGSRPKAAFALKPAMRHEEGGVARCREASRVSKRNSW